MFCVSCGTEVMGKFCPNCGAAGMPTPQQPATPNINNSNIQTINGAQMDIHKIIRTYGKHKLGASAYLSKETGISLRKAKEIMDPIYGQLGSQVNISFSDRLKTQVSMTADKVDDKKELKARYDREGTAYCPKCLSTSLSANKKGFGIGKAVIGLAAGPIGLVAGNIGARKVRITCLKCGNQFMAGHK